jgi:hypothetical protein
MKIAHIIFSFVISLLFLACEDDSVDATSSSGGSTSNALIHNQGVDCSTCHLPNSTTSGASVIIDSGGTLFNLINAANATAGVDLVNYKVLLVKSGVATTFTESTKGTGDFYTDENITSDGYTAQIRNSDNELINSSPADHGLSKKNCNSCHTASGANGTKGRVVEKVSYSANVSGHLSACNGCHNVNYSWAVGDLNVKVNTSSPDDSLLLQKARGVSHGGGSVLSTSSTAYKSVYEWIREGALNN